MKRPRLRLENPRQRRDTKVETGTTIETKGWGVLHKVAQFKKCIAYKMYMHASLACKHMHIDCICIRVRAYNGTRVFAYTHAYVYACTLYRYICKHVLVRMLRIRTPVYIFTWSYSVSVSMYIHTCISTPYTHTIYAHDRSNERQHVWMYGCVHVRMCAYRRRSQAGAGMEGSCKLLNIWIQPQPSRSIRLDSDWT